MILYPRSLSILTGKHKSKFSPLTLHSFLLRKELGSSLKSPLSNPRVPHIKRKTRFISFLIHTFSKKLEQSRNSLPLMPTGPTPKRKKTLSSSLPLILLGPTTRKGKSFHARVIYFYFPSRTINLVRILAILILESMISSRNF